MQSITRSIQLLELLQQSPNIEAGIAELSTASGLPVSTVHRLLHALQELGCVQQSRFKGRYRLGPRLMQLGLSALHNIELHRVAYPYMEHLTKQTLEITYLSIVDGLYAVAIEKVESPLTVRLFEPLGARVPLYAGASRKVLLAYMPDDTIERMQAAGMLVPRTPLTVVDPVALRAELALIRAQGYAISHGENSIDAAGIAIPLWDSNDKLVASLGLACSRARFTEEREAELRSLVLETGRQIAEAIGGRTAR